MSVDGRQIGRVYPDPMDKTVNHNWCYEHISRIQLRELRPDWPWERTYQSSFTKRGAAEDLVELDRKITAHEAAGR